MQLLTTAGSDVPGGGPDWTGAAPSPVSLSRFRREQGAGRQVAFFEGGPITMDLLKKPVTDFADPFGLKGESTHAHAHVWTVMK